MGHCHKRETDVSDFSECEVTNISLQFKTFSPYFLYAFYIFKTCTGVRRSTKLRKFFAETSKTVVFLRYFYYAGIGKSTRVEISTDVKIPTFINTNYLLQS